MSEFDEDFKEDGTFFKSEVVAGQKLPFINNGSFHDQGPGQNGENLFWKVWVDPTDHTKNATNYGAYRISGGASQIFKFSEFGKSVIGDDRSLTSI